MAYFKDVTFGVLYEQIKGKELLQNMIDSTLYNKLSRPLEIVVDMCQNFERSSELIKFEQSLNLHQDQLLSTKLCSIIYQSQLMIFRLKDMRDWSLLNRCAFNKNIVKFEMYHTLLDVKNLAIKMAKPKNITIHFDTYFENPNDQNQF